MKRKVLWQYYIDFGLLVSLTVGKANHRVC